MTVTAPAPAGPLPGQGSPGAGPGRGALADWRRWRAPAAVVLLVLLGGLIVALLQGPAPVAGPLGPNAPGRAGAPPPGPPPPHPGPAGTRAGPGPPRP